ncbi:hypothetical protein CU044_6356 [Streptomyces sp. L-9-10]|nr:hypothetical protein CU044_6356 [Streptomyces sp. L-9-10]
MIQITARSPAEPASSTGILRVSSLWTDCPTIRRGGRADDRLRGEQRGGVADFGGTGSRSLPAGVGAQPPGGGSPARGQALGRADPPR